MKGWRTILFNVAMVVVAIAETLPPKTALYVTVVGNAVLRVITNTPVGSNKPR